MKVVIIVVVMVAVVMVVVEVVVSGVRVCYNDGDNSGGNA